MTGTTSPNLRSPVRGPAAVMVAIAVSLAVASALHLSGNVSGRSEPYDAQRAGIAEALICAVLLGSVFVMVRSPRRARTAGLIGTGFATFGFLWGLNMTARGGHWPDIVYHLALLPVLIGTLVVLVRNRGAGRKPV